jgi:putative SOS response-associated peptidase YedK
MCGRYYVEMDDAELAEIAKQAATKAQIAYRGISLKKSGEIYPSDTVPVMTETDIVPMKWGFSLPGKKLLINARFETFTEKITYKNTLRCLIPASGYFEWKHDTNPKVKYAFSAPTGIMFLAGLYKTTPAETAVPNTPESCAAPPNFVILTRDAVGSLRDIHHRMPVIIPQMLVSDWFSGAFSLENAVTELEFREAEMPKGQIRLDL